MTREFQVYQGAAPQSAPVSGKQVPLFAGIPQNGAAVDAAIGEVQELGVKIGRLHDLGLQQRVTQERERIRSEMEVEMRQAADVAWGSEESLFRKDGSVNSDRYDAIVAKYWGQVEAISPGEFTLGENAVRYAGEQEAMRNDIALGMMKFTALKTLENTRKAFSDNLELAVGREDWEAARGLVEDARGSLLNDTEAEIELLKLKRGQLRASSRAAGYGYPASVNVGGTEYSGLSAALAMEDARHGAVSSDVSGVPADEADEAAPVQGDFSAPDALTATPVQVQDMREALTLMPLEEYNDVCGAFSDSKRVLTLPGVHGAPEVGAAPYAPECVQRVAAHGNVHGGVDAEQARMMVARIALDAVADNPGVTDAQVLSMFDDAGIYEAMGEGDAAVGKERCRSIVAEMVARGGADTDKLSMTAIEPMIRAHLSSQSFAESREWGRMAALNPGLEDDDDEWDKSDLDDAGRKRWFALYDVYRKYRQEYMPTASGVLDKDEFEEHAQRFYRWYMKNKYGELRRADMAAAEDWYTMRVAMELRSKAYVDAEGNGVRYAGYGHDVQVAREVLRGMPPASLGADELVAASVEMQRRDEVRSEAFRRAARGDYEALRGLKRDFAESGERAKKEREREAQREAREAERAARAEERRAEREAARRLFVARSAPREAEWVWDGQNALDGAQPGCLLPEAEYRRLHDELGFDGSQMVYVQVNGARVLVTGVSKSGRLELNSPAVAKVQRTPNARKGERWKTSGRLGFSYYFRSVEAK